jgi:hypothetical protein
MHFIHGPVNTNGRIDHVEDDDDDCKLSSETEYEKMDPLYCSHIDSSIVLESATNYFYNPEYTDPVSDISRGRGRRNCTPGREIEQIRYVDNLIKKKVLYLVTLFE